ncbi:beta-propeller domain-containing protein [Candidatus Woesearchaeota archaeon]|nr:beta-propeller domain-containing protein [Candidatus Woesearchaeota archaeon]
MNMNKKIIVMVLVLSILAFGCNNTQVDPVQQPSSTTAYNPGTYTEPSSISFSEEIKTEQFKSEEELLGFLKENSGSSGDYYGAGMLGGMVRTLSANSKMAVEESVSMDSSEGAYAPVPAMDYSETNVQVKGIDEADMLKTDGEYIYTITGSMVFIIKAYPGEDAEIVSTIKFDNAPQGLFVKNGKLAVFGSFYNYEKFRAMSFMPRSGMTFLNIYDVANREEPKLVKEYKFEGYYFEGRMKDDYAYVLTNTIAEYRPREPTPIIFDGEMKTAMPVDHIYYFSIPYSNPIFVNIHSINLDDPDELNSEAIAVESSQNLYMSQNNIFITYTEYINEWDIQKKIMMGLLEPKLAEDDRALIEKIKVTDNDVLSRWEKEQKIYQVYENMASMMTQDERDELTDKAEELLKKKMEEYKHLEFTVINKIKYDKGTIKPVANGNVPGHIINQFSMDERDNVLRIATTLNARWSRYGQQTKSTSNIYALDANLNTMSSLEGLAENEQIYSTRFIDERLYMVTFRQVDPFFVIDLSDPENIKELGKLKIPGFSRYLHPYDKDTIIGIGQDATETGRTKGLKISLFDVSDVTNPKEIAKYVTESRYASSNALYEHKAFLFSREKNLLVIPTYNYNYQNTGENYNGAFVFRITKDEIELRGLIDHSMGSTDRYWQPSVERSLYIEELLYTKSPSLLRINRLEDLSKVKNVELKSLPTEIRVY